MSRRANPVLALARRVQPHLPAPVVRIALSAVTRVRRLRRDHRGGLRRQVSRLRSEALGEVTVVVTSFNDERFLDDCLWSIRRQTYPLWRCIVVDDASTDASVAVAARHAHDDGRIRVVQHGVNAGLSAARNSGLLRATSPWICFLDADDFLLGASLADRVAVLAAARPDVVGSYSGSVTVAERATVDQFPKRLDGEVSAFEDLLSGAGSCPFPAHAPLLRRDVLVAAGGFDESMRSGAEDWDLWLRLMRSGYQFLGCGSRSVAYRMKRASMVGRDPAGHLGVGRALLDSVHEPADETRLVPGAPGALIAPLAEQMRALAHAQRILAFAPMIAVEDPESARAQIASIEPSTWLLLARRDDLDHRVATAAQRAAQTHPRGADADGLAQRVLEWVGEARSGPSVAAPEPAPLPALVVASNASEVETLLPKHTDDLWLVLDREDGAHGVGPALAGSPATTVTVSDLALGRLAAAPNTVIVGDNPTVTAARLRDDPARGWAELLADDVHSIEEYPEHAADGDAMAELAGSHRGERAVIIGNGPSLRQTDLQLLRDEITFGVNGIFYARDEMGFDPTYYVVEDTSVMRENADAIRRQPARRKFFPSMYRDLYGADDATFFNLNRGFYDQRSPNRGVPRFSVDAAQRVYAGQSVTFVNLQLAYHMGFTSVVLVGVDFDYVIPDDADKDGDVITSRSADPNHFHPDYFGPGKTWKEPQLDRVAQNYRLARAMFEADGREIINATVGGKLELFPRSELETLVSR